MSDQTPSAPFLETPKTPKNRKSKTKRDSTSLTRLGKDVMPLAEQPFAALKRYAPGKVIYLEWERQHPVNGKMVKASWRVDGDSELGLPGPPEVRLYLVLMELSREQGFPEKVMFSRHDILQRLGLKKNAKAYEALRQSFLRLVGTKIEARNLFFNPQTRHLAASKMFSQLNDVELVDEDPGRRADQLPLALSSFTWSEVMREFFAQDNIRSLDIEFVLSLKLPLSVQLFRFLDKHRAAPEGEPLASYTIGVRRLCEIHLGMEPSPYDSKLKERLAPAHTELVERGFLKSVGYEPMKSGRESEKIVYSFVNAPLKTSPLPLLDETLLANGSDSGLLPAIVTPMGLMPNARDIMVAMDSEDEEKRGAACDQVFGCLSDAERERIEEKVIAGLAPFLRENRSSPGFKRELDKGRRREIWFEFPEAVRAILIQNAEHEISQVAPVSENEEDA